MGLCVLWGAFEGCLESLKHGFIVLDVDVMRVCLRETKINVPAF